MGLEGVAQMVEHLPSKYKALSLNLSTAKKKKNHHYQIYLVSEFQKQ
jgi:hypothetical protein